ncbi:cyclic nucleotide-binding domain-containing protein [Aeoliella mucimassa]|uniref:NADH-dependent phenylglyoxylate dehydrogenase subunit beta n=1 Tax=Aeoliella mucimassa TaxID=2527972 RepID=A0A518AKI9_9BACT|nr:cyclic nucleotide-binding domain-containing protein [Aeoliella mucimassa]QDU55194.1 NADH-dependent phenylglyoxylate dehydrogenase subunit beta [Aeoliella mucimassa]
MSTAETTFARPARWDVPFSEMMSQRDVERLLGVEPFRSIDASRFPKSLPLNGILKNDARIVEFQSGDLVIREGDYGSSAFMLLHGTLHVALESLAAATTARAPQPRKSWLRAIAQVFASQQVPEIRERPVAVGLDDDLGLRGEGELAHVFLQDVPRVLDGNRTAKLEPGEFFGELAALARSPRTASVFAETTAVVLEIRWQGLRDIMRRAPAVQQHIDHLYRTNSLRVHLRETPLLADLPAAALDEVAAATEFASYGSFDWNIDFAKSEAMSPLEQIAREPLIAEEGSVVESLRLVRSGFVRMSRKFGAGHRTLAYLGKGQVLGAGELLVDVDEHPIRHEHSLRAVGHVDLLEIPIEVVRSAVLPHLSDARRTELQAASTRAMPEVNLDRLVADDEQAAPTPLVDFMVDQRLVNGTQAMVIDLDRCTRCDDCVRACATTHDGNPRFVREGPRFGRYQFASACMHCTDPVCMIGCPTGAIHRDIETGTVRINDSTCVGCATCANSCPYTNIQMVEVRDQLGHLVVDSMQELPIVKATKCDLCSDGLGGPACVRACSHDALVRLDMADLNQVAKWMNR